MVEQILNQCVVENNLVRLPQQQLDRDTYVQVANKLKKIGGKWTGGKVQAFVFPHDPTDLLADIQGGKERNLKKEFQFFATPETLAKRLVELAEIETTSWVLEPSAGYGAIIREIPKCQAVHYCEINDLCLKTLTELPCVNEMQMVGSDFLQFKQLFSYDRIVANPPFSKNQDIDHIRKMYSVLAFGGVLVSVASRHWQIDNNRKEVEFREWLNGLNAEIFPVDEGTFKESGTNIATIIIRIRK